VFYSNALLEDPSVTVTYFGTIAADTDCI